MGVGLIILKSPLEYDELGSQSVGCVTATCVGGGLDLFLLVFTPRNLLRRRQDLEALPDAR